MHARPKPRLSPHRRARIIAWALAMLLWLRAVLDGVHVMSRRQRRRRGGFFCLDHLARLTTDLIAIRAAEIAGNRAPRKRLFRDRGVDLKRRHFRRSVIGSRLRRALKHRDFDTRIAILIHALRDIEPLATRLARRMRRRVTKLWAILPRAGAAESRAIGAACASFSPDTS